MTTLLLTQLEQKVEHAVEVIELLRLQIDELLEENACLKAEQEKWRNDLVGLLSRFDQIEEATAGDHLSTLDLDLDDEALNLEFDQAETTLQVPA